MGDSIQKALAIAICSRIATTGTRKKPKSDNVSPKLTHSVVIFVTISVQLLVELLIEMMG